MILYCIILYYTTLVALVSGSWCHAATFAEEQRVADHVWPRQARGWGLNILAQRQHTELLAVWFLVGNGGMGYWDYYRGP